MPPTRHDAIAAANAHLEAAGLPTYNELILALRDGASRMPHSSSVRMRWIEHVIGLLRRAGAV